jgi:hypothetical protein
MGTKLNFKTYLQNRFFDFLSHLFEGPKSYGCTKTLVLYILYPFTVRCVCYATLSLTLGVKKKTKLKPND